MIPKRIQRERTKGWRMPPKKKDGLSKKSGATLTHREVNSIREAYNDYGIPSTKLAEWYALNHCEYY